MIRTAAQAAHDYDADSNREPPGNYESRESTRKRSLPSVRDEVKEKTIHEQGIVSVLRQLHDELDRAVFDAYTLDQYPEPATAGQLARTFRNARSKRVSEILDTLVAMGQAREDDGKYAGA